MKVLYAVQATGNGHITRARVMAKVFKALHIEVDWVFTGRDRDSLFDMQIFGDFKCLKGLTFSIRNGKVDHIKTIFKNNLFSFVYDVLSFDFTGYDIIINDFEPITAWSAKIKKIKTYGLSHQMAFQKDIPIAGKSLIASLVLKHFAPVSFPMGLHWDAFDQSLLPPIVEKPTNLTQLIPNKILVYFPFCDSEKLVEWFSHFTQFEFYIFHGETKPSGFKHIHILPFSRKHFLTMQANCGGVITAAGFELPSEAIQYGQKLLLLPLNGQMEQQSNALALRRLNRATIIHDFSQGALEKWLTQPLHQPIIYPNVACAVAKWLVSLEKESLASLSKRLWLETTTHAATHYAKKAHKLG
ncbi:glycosyltransferase family protein [Aliikangiella sp. IMCC44653]